MKEREGERKKAWREEDSNKRTCSKWRLWSTGETDSEAEEDSGFGQGRGRLTNCTGQALFAARRHRVARASLHMPTPCPWNMSHQLPPWPTFYLWSSHHTSVRHGCHSKWITNYLITHISTPWLPRGALELILSHQPWQKPFWRGCCLNHYNVC